jgi:predicted nucleic acid-binding Zn ribbon protein
MDTEGIVADYVKPVDRCRACGKSLRNRRPSARYCSDACRQWARRHRVEITMSMITGGHPGTRPNCGVCGKPIEGRRRDARWCSTACEQRARRYLKKQREAESA